MTDEAQLVKIAQEDSQHFVVLYDRYAERIYAYAQRECQGDTALAQDVVSATFEKALVNLHKYEWRGTSFGAWLYKIARNELMMYHRKQKWYAPLVDTIRGTFHVEDVVHANQQHRDLYVGMKKLSMKDQELLRLYYHEELSQAEIAEVLGCTRSAAGVRIHRALERLRKHMGQPSNKQSESRMNG